MLPQTSTYFKPEGKDPLPIEYDAAWAPDSVLTSVNKKIYDFCLQSNHDCTVICRITLPL
jgi:hypothetical protein